MPLKSQVRVRNGCSTRFGRSRPGRSGRKGGDPIISGPFLLTVTDDLDTEADWKDAGPYALPVGGEIRIEWCFSGTGGIDDDYMGWYIDDVVVIETTP